MAKSSFNSQDLPIGIFDSGIGGLTVSKAVIDLLPNENIIYLGDTARIPYGPRSKETITKFALELVAFLLRKKVKALVVACNTISANALDEIKKTSRVPVINVIDPTMAAAEKISKNGKIAVAGTFGTINSPAYKACKIRLACPLFVPLAEEGETDSPAAELIARGYLSGLKDSQIDTLILGCTHYPLLRTTIAKAIGNKIKIIESGIPTAEILQKILKEKGLLRKSHSGPKYEFYFTDNIDRVKKVAQNFFGKKLPGRLVKIDL